MKKVSVVILTYHDHDLQDYCVVKGDEYALVQIFEADRVSVEAYGDDSTVAEVELDGYNVTLIITEDKVKGITMTTSDSQHEPLRLNYFVVLTRIRDFHPKQSLEKKFGDFRSGHSSHASHSGTTVINILFISLCNHQY